MQHLGWQDFSAAEGTVYGVECGEERIELTLEVAEELPSSGREGGSFRLEFRGPPAPMLAQGTYGFELPNGVRDIFIVPIAQNGEGTLYEAIFY